MASVKVPQIKFNIKVVALLLLGVVATVLVYMFFTAPMKAGADAAHEETVVAQQVLDKNRQRISDITSGKKTTAAQLLVQARDLDKKLPEAVDNVALVAAIPGLAQAHNVTVKQMDPAATGDAKASTSGVQVFTVAADGRPEDIAAWIADLQSYSAAVTVTNPDMSVSGAGSANVKFQLNAFFVPTKALPPGK